MLIQNYVSNLVSPFIKRPTESERKKKQKLNLITFITYHQNTWHSPSVSHAIFEKVLKTHTVIWFRLKFTFHRQF